MGLYTYRMYTLCDVPLRNSVPSERWLLSITIYISWLLNIYETIVKEEMVTGDIDTFFEEFCCNIHELLNNKKVVNVK